MSLNPALPRRHLGLALAALTATATQAQSAEPPLSGDATQVIEQTLLAARDAQRGVTLYLQGQTLSGLVQELRSGQWVSLRSQQFGRIVVRLDRIDAVARS